MPDAALQETRVKGKLKRSIRFWQTFCQSTVVLSWILNGYSIDWAGQPPAPYEKKNHAGAYLHANFVSEQIADLLSKGLVQEVFSKPTVVSPLNVIERRDKLRLILDLQYVNRFLDRSDTHFHYETLSWAPVVFSPSDLLFSVDLESAYHHVDMHPSAWDYLGFEWQGQYYVFTVLPFGLSTACWVFTKITREL